MITLLNKFDDSYIMREKDVLEITDSYIKANNIEPYLNNVRFDSTIDHLGHYNYKKREIVFNPNELIKPSNGVFEKLESMFPMNEKYHSYFVNFECLWGIYHELCHVNQQAKYEMNIDKSDDMFVYLFKLCDELPYNESVHELYPMEIDAKINGVLTAYNLMKYTKLPRREVKILYTIYLTTLIDEYQKNNYRVISPIFRLFKVYNEIDLLKITKLTIQNKLSKTERLNFGLDIDDKEYDGIEKDITDHAKVLTR